MKPFILTLVISCLAVLSYGQDVIIKLPGEKVPAKVEEIFLREILYSHPDSLQGPSLRLAKTEVFMIRFANGTREVFQENLPGSQARQEPALTLDRVFQQGHRNARLFYKGNEALWGAGASSQLFPYGLAGAVVIGAVPSRVRADGVSNTNLLINPNYVRGYEKEVPRPKVGKAATGAGMEILTGLMYDSFVGLARSRYILPVAP